MYSTLAISTSVFGIDTFVIQDIRVEGLQRVTPGAVFSALPVRVGDEIDDEISNSSIQALFGTGLFTDIQLERDGDTLVVVVVERPSIGSISVTGNRRFKDEQIENALQSNNIAEGRVYNEQQVERFVEGLKQEYISEGRFSADVRIAVEPQVRNRVNVAIEIFEGPRALIKEIRFIGNEDVDSAELLDEMSLSTKKTWGFLNRKNRYSRTILDADLEKIANYYLNLGYIDFELNSARTIIGDNREDIFIVISLQEGKQYNFGKSKVLSDQQVVSDKNLEELVDIEEGELFSRTRVSETRQAMIQRLADDGYAFADVEAFPDINREDLTVNINYAVDSGRMIHIRRILILGNITTQDEVIRRELRVYEGSVYSAAKLLQSRERLGRLGLFESVDLRTEPVPDVEDQVDIYVDVKERLTGFLSFGVGYSESEHALLQIRLEQKNLFGTGKQIGTEITYGKSDKDISINFLEPYFRESGVSRGVHLDYREFDSLDVEVTNYQENRFSVGVRYKYPLSEVSSFNFGMDADQHEFRRAGTQRTDYRIEDFIATTPKITIGKIVLGYSRDSRDRAVFASKGSELDLNLQLALGKVDYYILQAEHSQYFSVGENTTMKLTGQLDYGNGLGNSDFPFFENFYAGGSSTVRGFRYSSLGPRELCRSGTDPNTFVACPDAETVGGNVRILGRAELFLPLFGTSESPDKRFSIFMDAGNVFGSNQKVNFSEIRASAGLSFIWLSPIGPIGASYALPVRQKAGDRIDRFQISLGTFLD